MKGLYFGRVSDVNTDRGMIKAAYQAPYETISEWLPLLAFEYSMPEIGAYVAIIIDENENGICLGKIYSNEQRPEQNKGYYKRVGEAVITASETGFKIQAGNGYIEFTNGTVKIHVVKTIIDNYDGECKHE